MDACAAAVDVDWRAVDIPETPLAGAHLDAARRDPFVRLFAELTGTLLPDETLPWPLPSPHIEDRGRSVGLRRGVRRRRRG